MIENRISDRAKILLIDEDTSISYLIRRAMEKENYKIYIAGSGKQGMEMSTGVCPDLILMDNKFSDMEGITLIQWFREWTDCPIIILSERSSYLDKVEALYAGADDYMVKPIDFEELILRIGAILRRSKIVNDHKITIGNTILDYNSLSVTSNGECNTLPKKEFYLLFKLVSSPDTIFTRRQLLDEIWGMESMADERTVDVHIKRIRERYRDSNDFEIVTVRGLGYKAVIKS